MRTVVFDAMGVLYTSADDVTAELIPYLREANSPLSDNDITHLYHEASLGRLTSAQFWDACGVSGDDELYCTRHSLVPGMITLLKDLVAQKVPLACLSNDVSEWSRILRQRFHLDEYIDTWVISGEIRTRKPSEEAFTVLMETIDTPPGQIIFFDDRPNNVAAANNLGIDAIDFIGVPEARDCLRQRGIEV